jgi:hypothetical protein
MAMEVSLLQDQDFAPTAKLLARVFGGSEQGFLADFEHWWRENPHWTPGVPRGWVIRSGGDILAFTANIPFRYFINNDDSLCCVTGSTSVAPECRGQGLSKAVGKSFAQQRQADLLLGTGSTDIAYKMWVGLGFSPVSRSWPKKSTILLGDIGALLRSRGTIAATAETVLDFAWPSSPGEFEISRLNTFVNGDEKSLLECRASHAVTYPRRDVRIANWLFFGSSHMRRTRIILAARRAGSLFGYLAMKSVGRSCLLLECRCRNADPKIARALMIGARKHMAQQGISFLRIWQYTPMIRRATAGLPAFSRKGPPMMTYLFKTVSKDIDQSTWEMSPGDGDICIN